MNLVEMERAKRRAEAKEKLMERFNEAVEVAVERDRKATELERAEWCAAALNAAGYRGLRWERGEVGLVVGRGDPTSAVFAALSLDEAESVVGLTAGLDEAVRNPAEASVVGKLRADATPGHYAWSGVPPIDVIEAWGMGPPFCLGNAIKYIGRWKHKDGLKDLVKARDYIGLAIAMLEREEGR